MEKEYLDFLQDTIKYLGFGEHTFLNREIEEKINEGSPSFELETHSCFDVESLITARLYFTRGKEKYSERYFLNKYEAHLHYQQDPKKDKRYRFRIENNRYGVTFKQAFNLLEGRYVQKKIVDQNEVIHDWWIHLETDLLTPEGYGHIRYIKRQFELEKVLEKYPISELNHPKGMERLCSSLRRGNLQKVTLVHESGKVDPQFVYANPERSGICLVSTALKTSIKSSADLPIVEYEEFEHADAVAINESTLEEEGRRARKKAHL